MTTYQAKDGMVLCLYPLITFFPDFLGKNLPFSTFIKLPE